MWDPIQTLNTLPFCVVGRTPKPSNFALIFLPGSRSTVTYAAAQARERADLADVAVKHERKMRRKHTSEYRGVSRQGFHTGGRSTGKEAEG